MNDIVRREHPDAVMHRHANAMSEIKKLHEDCQDLLTQSAEDRRVIDRQANMIDLLKAELSKSQQWAKVCERKLVRLASAMSHIGRLSEEAQAIMRDAKEIIETEEEAESERVSAAQAVANLPPRG